MVMPYTNVTQSGVLNLAVAVGVPAIVSDLPGLREDADGSALLVPPADPAGLAAALRTILTDDTLHAELHERQIARRERTSFANVAATLDELYGRLTAGPDARHS
jgi:glycosyltransferase involved in cell wall biosynthesis